MTPKARIASGVGITLVVSACVLYVVFAGVQSFSQAQDAVSPADRPGVVLQKKGMASWLLSKMPVLPWAPQQEQLIAVMIENHQVSRPYHVGLEKAVLIEEFFVEGYISRFVALFRLQDLPPEVGPVRSLRPYFIQAFLPWTSFVFHAGGSPEALDRVQDFNDVQNYNAIYLEEAYYDRKLGVPAPHDLFLPAEDITALLAEDVPVYGRETALPLYPTGRAMAGSGASVIYVNFYSPVHNTQYIYNEKERYYERVNGRTVSPATPENLVFLAMDVEEVGPLGRLAIQSVGKGDALYFRFGRVYKGTWQRSSETEPYQLLQENGEPMVFATGQIWLTSVNSLQRIRFE